MSISSGRLVHDHSLNIRVLVLIAGFTLLLQSINVLYMLHAEGCESPLLVCPFLKGAWATNDTSEYISIAQQILSDGLTSASYLTRPPGYPVLLAASIFLTGEPTPAIWIGPVWAAIAVASMVWLTFDLSHSRNAAVGAGVLFVFWPNAYQYTTLLMTDALHAFVVVTALVMTWRWRKSERSWLSTITAGLWIVAQALRPTFVMLPLLLPFLLWKEVRSRRYIAYSTVLWLSTLVLPIFLVISNASQHGVPTISSLTSEALACYSVPRTKEELGMGNFSDLRSDCWRRYEHMATKSKLASQTNEVISFVSAHPLAYLKSFVREFSDQLTHPLTPYYFASQEPLYPPITNLLGSNFMIVYWFCAFTGLITTSRASVGLKFFLILVFFIIMCSASLSHLVGGRLRLPLDLLYMPFVCIFVDRLINSASGLYKVRE